jgi:hypothetical protein
VKADRFIAAIVSTRCELTAPKHCYNANKKQAGEIDFRRPACFMPL